MLAKNITTLLRLIELTRFQPQYGYVLGQVSKSELSDLAQHHYLVTFIAWRLAALVMKAGANLNLAKVLEYSLIHDVGEIFGGDIAMPYAKANPPARQAAKKFEEVNQKYLAQFFGDDAQYIENLFQEIMNAQTDEALIAKIADYVEVTHYKLNLNRLTKGDIIMVEKKLKENISHMKDKKAKKALTVFLSQWKKDLKNGHLEELFEQSKRN
jgi:5'-deoxynucleotidase YfbR-like HD superfamily hydrolase